MGCCASQQNIQRPVRPIVQQQVRRNIEPEMVQAPYLHSKPKMDYLYMIGTTDRNQKLLIKFDPKTESLSTINNLPEQYEFFNYSSMVCFGNEKFLISGGINLKLTSITNKCLIYHGNQNTFNPASCMNQFRYTHIATYYAGYVYVFGGRNYGSDETAMIRKCERYDVAKDKWSQIPDMKTPRCTGFAIIWKQQIFVFGGYSAPYKRSKAIEIFNPVTNQWRLCQFKLHRGLECGTIIANPYNCNEFILLGGNMRHGPVDTVNVYNLQKGTVHARKSMYHARVLQKGFEYDNKVYIIGGCDEDNIQICDLKQFNWRRKTAINIKNIIEPSQLDKFTHNIFPYEINVGQSVVRTQKFEYKDQIVFLFGTDAQPFILQFNISIPYAISHPVPLNMKCLRYQSGASIPGGKFILLGGSRDQLDKVKNNVYQYDSQTRTAKQLSPMKKSRYAFPSVYCEKYIYAIAGRTMGYDQQAILNSCERLNIDTYKWEDICPLPTRVVSAMAFVFKSRVYVTGGFCPDKERVLSVYQFQESMNYWRVLPFALPFGLEGSAILWKSDKQILFLGGRVYSGDSNKVWEMSITSQAANGQINDAIFYEVGELSERKCLHKAYHPRHQDFAVIFGGVKETISFYNMKHNKIENSDILSNVFLTFGDEIHSLHDQQMKSYLLLSQYRP